MCLMTWRMKATPAGRPLFRLQVSVPSTAETGSGSSATSQPHPSVATKDGLWTTPTTEVSEKKVPYAQGGKSLAYQVSESQRLLWPTPVADDTHRSVEAHLAMKRDMKGGPRNTITSLSVAVKDATSEEPVMLWPTPNAARAANVLDLNCSSDGRTRPNKLGWAVAEAVGLWPTPCATESRQGYQDRTRGKKGTQVSLSTAAMKADGQGAGGQKLNPAFVERLMGYPPGWTDLSTSSDEASSTGSR